MISLFSPFLYEVRFFWTRSSTQAVFISKWLLQIRLIPREGQGKPILLDCRGKWTFQSYLVRINKVFFNKFVFFHYSQSSTSKRSYKHVHFGLEMQIFLPLFLNGSLDFTISDYSPGRLEFRRDSTQVHAAMIRLLSHLLSLKREKQKLQH